jgi:hypothetical protein
MFNAFKVFLIPQEMSHRRHLDGPEHGLRSLQARKRLGQQDSDWRVIRMSP